MMAEDGNAERDTEEFFDTTHAGEVLAELNRQRFSAQHLCDATLRTGNGSGTIRLKAHKSMLAACSEYFRTLFTSKLAASPSLRAGIVDVDIEAEILKKILTFMYTGKLKLCMEYAQDILSAADFLCIDTVKQYCSQFLHHRITLKNCICVKFLAEKYNLHELGQEALTVATSSTVAVFETEDALEFPFEYVFSLLRDPLLNYISEKCLYRFVINWINSDFQKRSKYFRLLFDCIEPNYLPRHFLREKATTEPLLTPEFLDAEQYSRIFLDETPDDGRNFEDVILCRSRSVSVGDQVCVLCYHIVEDKWSRLRLPATHALDGLESMVHHNNALYFLVSKVEDMFGYMHSTPETKLFWRCDLRTGSWDTLEAPANVKGTCRLVSHVNGVYVIDRSGQVEEYDTDQGKWTLTAEAMFDCSTPTLYVVPMPMDRYMYILRVFSAGYSFSYSQLSFSLHRLDTVHGSHRKLSEIEASELDLADNEHMFGYSIKPGQFTLTNELGRPRVIYNLVGQSWTTCPSEVKLPAFVAEVWGSVPWQGRVYFVGRTKKDYPIFMFYDVTKGRFKATVAPPTHLSGVVCHVVADRTELRNQLIP